MAPPVLGSRKDLKAGRPCWQVLLPREQMGPVALAELAHSIGALDGNGALRIRTLANHLANQILAARPPPPPKPRAVPASGKASHGPAPSGERDAFSAVGRGRNAPVGEHAAPHGPGGATDSLRLDPAHHDVTPAISPSSPVASHRFRTPSHHHPRSPTHSPRGERDAGGAGGAGALKGGSGILRNWDEEWGREGILDNKVPGHPF